MPSRTHAQCGKLRAAVESVEVIDGARDPVGTLVAESEKMAAGVEGHWASLAVEEPSSLPKLSAALNPRPRVRWSGH